MKTIVASRVMCVNRLADAEQFLIQAQTTSRQQGDSAAGSRAAVSSFVLAGIAAADVICGVALGVRYNGPNHSEAPALLAKVPGLTGGQRQLQTLTGLKTKAQYASAVIGAADVVRAERAAISLVEEARRAVR